MRTENPRSGQQAANELAPSLSAAGGGLELEREKEAGARQHETTTWPEVAVFALFLLFFAVVVWRER